MYSAKYSNGASKSSAIQTLPSNQPLRDRVDLFGLHSSNFTLPFRKGDSKVYARDNDRSQFMVKKIDRMAIDADEFGNSAGGDIVTGSATVILAMGAGRTAAQDIHQKIERNMLKPEKDVRKIRSYEYGY